ncbi:MAG: TetR/AcrR family transcriptional regulator [Geminicoccaceae bacterium]
MPRPSLKDVRSAEILAAFASCVARFGLEGATQERIAEAAGVKRTILRHYLGNRDDMIDALIDFVVADFDAQSQALFDALPNTDRVPVLLDVLFGASGRTNPDMVLVFEALVAAVDRYPKAREALLAWTRRFIDAVEAELAMAFPTAAKDKIAAAGHGIVALYFNADSLHPLQPPKSWDRALRAAADLLIESLKGSQGG